MRGEGVGEGGGEGGGEGDGQERRACTKACVICRKGFSFCWHPGQEGHLLLAEASCPCCTPKKCKKGKRPELRQPCLKRGKPGGVGPSGRYERHWPAPPAAIEQELGAPVAIMGLLTNRS